MRLRLNLRSPEGPIEVRDVVDGLWAEPAGASDVTLGEDLWALPGLVDAHAHLAQAELNYEPGDLDGAIERSRFSLAAGVTLILDKGWSDDTVTRLIEAVSPGERPEIEAAARIIASPGGYYPGFALEVEPDELPQAVRHQAKAAAGWVKLSGDWPRRGVGPVGNFDGPQLEEAVRVAAAAGSKVAIHTMAPEVPSLAVAAGVQSIEHGLFLAEDDLGPLGDRGGMWVPTILRCEATLSLLGAESSGGRLFAEGLERIASLLPLAVEAGVHVLAGTDLIGSPADIAAEAMKLGEYGLSNDQVVAAVSTSAFLATGRSARFAPGTPADAVLLPENPIDDPRVLEHPQHVVRLGVVS